MPIGQVIDTTKDFASNSTKIKAARPWRLVALAFLWSCLLALMVFLRTSAPPFSPQPIPINWLLLWSLCFIPYLIASFLILSTQPLTGYWRWIEVGAILLGAIILRLTLLPLDPNLSHDSWRYLWDARVTLHGYSPYAYAPNDPVLLHLRNIVYENSRYRNVPTLYPPGAQLFYLLSYLIAPDNLTAFKGLLIVLEMIACGALLVLLVLRKADLGRCLIYAWCPLPIVEFALQGHHEAITLTLTVLAVACSYLRGRLAAPVVGFLVALATLTNIYPILLLAALLPNRSRRWITTCLLVCGITIVVAYVPYIIMGNGRILGFFTTYIAERGSNGGWLQLIILWIREHLPLPQVISLLSGYAIDLLFVGSITVLIWWLCWRKLMSRETAALIFVATIFSVASHILPWYPTALLPWVALLVTWPWTRRTTDFDPRALAVVLVWYFVCTAPIMYVVDRTGWQLYYLTVYGVMLISIIGSAIILYQKKKHNGKIVIL